MPYALPNAWELSKRRLELLEACHDAASMRAAEALDIGPDWRCLEAGAGNGSFARWLAARAGSVVAVDLDVRLLEAVDEPNLEVRRLDLESQELPEAAFDFVHTRMVLMHLPARDAVLRRLAAALRPGGVMLIEEDEIHPVLSTSEGAYLDTWHAFHDVMRAAGTDAEWAGGLPERLAGLGLADVDARLEGHLFPGGSPRAQFWSLTWLQVRDRLLAAGHPAAVLDEACAALEDPGRWFHGPATVIVWGRRPAGP